MKKQARKTLAEKIQAAVSEVLKNNKTKLTDKIEKAIRKSARQVVKKLDKNIKSAEKKKVKKKPSGSRKKMTQKNPLTAVAYKKIKTR